MVKTLRQKPKALIFDVFGTLVDWRNSIAREVAAVLPDVDAFAFADAWRAEYDPAMKRIRDGGRGYVPLDDLHLENLGFVLEKFNASTANPEALSKGWERLNPWPDVVSGLTALKKHAIIAPCSNGSIALMTRLARYGGLPWDCILGAEIAQDYKPKPEVYIASSNALRLPASEVMMVAAHNGDLKAARAAGLQTAFICRPKEHGKNQQGDLGPTDDWEFSGDDLNTLNDALFG